MKDKNMGLYNKFFVRRADGSSAPGSKHEHCFYYVLDLEHDPHAIAALKAYIDSCRHKYPELARDLQQKVEYYGSLHNE